MGKLVNKKELCEILGKSERTITTWQKNGLPIELEARRGQSNTYDTEQVLDWLISREIAGLTSGEGGAIHDYEAERARLTHHQANKTSLEEDVLKGKLIPADLVEQVQGDMVTAFRSRILSIPTKAAHALLGIEDINESKETLKEFLYEALNELSDYRPDKYGIESVGESCSDGGAATGSEC